ncbi:MAG: DUF5684 domain-containing protein [Cyclobacteriaceae bacterium]|nr:DUF5684 domain-containing protein [Cyclobacteriaceae bacterium]
MENIGTVGILVYVALIILMIASMWKMFEKAGKPGWAAIIPIYNFIVLLEIVGKPAWWIILVLIPFVNFVILIWITNLTSKSFGNGVGFTLGLIFLPFIFYPVLGFGSATYKGAAGK